MMNFIIYLLLNDIIFFNNAICEDIFKDIITYEGEIFRISYK